MEQFFSDEQAAHRYNAHRPKVHRHIIELIKPYIPNSPMESALDIACGTGDSTVVLHQVTKRVVAVDRSMAMLDFAKFKCDHWQQLTAENLPQLNAKFNFLSTCMAFHWFDQEQVIMAYKAVSEDGAYWLIYNLGFAGQKQSKTYQHSQENFLRAFPTPSRRAALPNELLERDLDIKHIHSVSGDIDLRFDLASLVGYLCTQSNVESRIKKGENYFEIENELKEIFCELDFQVPFQYSCSVELYQYRTPK